jgi:hypothetical protein
MFCERCAVMTRTLVFDPAAETRAELMSGSCIWSDETHRDWCAACRGKTREVFHLRYRLTVGEAVPQAAVQYFAQLEYAFPNWPLFRPERRSPEIAERVRHLVNEITDRLLVEWERHDREFRQHSQGSQ